MPLFIALLHGLCPPALAAPDVGWLAGARVGGGYDGNIVASETLGDAQGAFTWDAGASVGGWLAPGRTRLMLGLSADTMQLPAFPDLSSYALQGSLGLRLPLAWHLDLSFGPFLGGRWTPDPARSSLDMGALADLGWRVRPWLRADLGYRYLHRVAGDPVYDRDAHRGRLSAEIRLARRTFLIVAGSLERGEAVFYDDVNLDVPVDVDVYVPVDAALAGRSGIGTGRGTDTGTGTGTGTGSGSQGLDRKPDDAPQTTTDSLGTAMIAWSAPAWTSTAELGLDQDLGRYLTVGLRGGFVDVQAEPASWQDLYVSLGLRLHLP